MIRIKQIAAALATALVLLGSASGLMAQSQTLGLPEVPHGYPAYFQDSNGLKLELCLDNATMCFFDPVTDPNNAFANLIGWEGEAFWFLAEATGALPGASGDQAILVLGIEATYGGSEAVVDGGQISFGRMRVRIDTNDSGAGVYRVLHPYGEEILVADAADTKGINFTRDIGAVNVLDPAAAFNGTLMSDVMNPGRALPLNATAFLTWPDYTTNASLQEVIDVNGTTVTRQYIGMPVPHTVVGSPYGAERNRFIVQKQNGGGWNTLLDTDLFTVHGRVFVDRTIVAKTTYGDQPPVQMLAGHGPINRATPFLAGSNATITGTIVPDYPVGYPLWYEDMSGLKLTITFPPMGISEPANASIPEQAALATGGETFFWSAMALQRDIPGFAGFDASVEFAMEGTFGGDESLVDGNQIAFGRTRIRIDTPAVGTYTVQHPYGNNTFEVTNATEGINYTADVGGGNPFDPDAAFIGALFGTIGPDFLTWSTFDPNIALNDPLLVKTVNGTRFSYVGDPAIPHPVKGGRYRNDVLITGPGINFTITDFTVTGQVFNPLGFGFLPSIYLLLNE